MNISPVKIVVYIFIVLLLLLGLTYLSKTYTTVDGKAKEGFYINNIGLKYPTNATFWESKIDDKKDTKTIDSIVDNIKKSIIVEAKTDFTPVEIIPDFTKIDTSKIQRIQYPENKDAFISLLKERLQSPLCRIIHYGDSQIEGDRISAYVRNRLQGQYGGNGPGFIPILQVYNQNSAEVIPSDNWLRFATFDPKNKRIEHNRYGVYTTFSRFTPVYDSIRMDSLPLTTATIVIKPSTRSYNKLQNFTNIGLHYGNVISPTTIKVYHNGRLIASDYLKQNTDYQNFKIQLDNKPESLKIELTSKISPDFYGLTLDSNQGIILDNVAMRGSSGTVFAGLEPNNFKKMMNQLDPKILIFQYGGNTVPYIKDSVAVENYARYIKNHIQWVRNKTDNASVIFIGPSDMTTSENGNLTTYKLLPYLNEVLQNTCLENNIAYWSMFDAMGGENAMKHWVEQGLASSDYTHFSPSGTRIIAEMLYLALYLDLNKKD